MLRRLELVIVIALAPTSASGAPDFSSSTIAFEPAQPVAGDVVTLTLNIRNIGSDAAPYAEVDLQLPRAGMFVDAGPGQAAIDLNDGTVSWKIAIAAGATETYAVRLVLPREGGGEVLLPRLRVRQLYTSTESWIHGEADVQARVTPAVASAFGLGIAPAGLAVLALIVAALVVWTVLRALARTAHGKQRAVVTTVTISIAVGFWMLFADLLWRDWRVNNEFAAAQCTVLDRRMRVTTSSSSTSGRGMARAGSTTVYRPLLALRYDVGGSPVISTGFDTRSRLQIGSGAREIESFERWPIGLEVPCWYDPGDPGDVVVIRGFGGAYFFALLPLPLFMIGVWTARTR